MIIEIAQIIKATKNPTQAALEIVEYLEDQGLSLEENGWLDDDSRWQDYQIGQEALEIYIESE